MRADEDPWEVAALWFEYASEHPMAAIPFAHTLLLDGDCHVTVTLRLDDEHSGAFLNRRAVELAELVRGHPGLEDQLGEVLILYRGRTRNVQAGS